MKKNKKKESLQLCMKYGYNCAFCPRNNKCEKETVAPKQNSVEKVIKLVIKKG